MTAFKDSLQTAATHLMIAMDDAGWSYLPHVGAAVAVYGHLDETPDVRLDAYGRQLTIDGKILHLLKSEFASDPAPGDSFERDGTTYTFQSPLRKDGYFYEVIVKEVVS